MMSLSHGGNVSRWPGAQIDGVEWGDGFVCGDIPTLTRRHHVEPHHRRRHKVCTTTDTGYSDPPQASEIPSRFYQAVGSVLEGFCFAGDGRNSSYTHRISITTTAVTPTTFA